MNNDNFFASFSMHTEVKLKLYKEYLQIYLRILLNAKFTNTIHIYDLFCGKGETDEGQVGSALISVKQAISSANICAKSKKLVVHLSDKNHEFCDVLQSKLASITIPVNVDVVVRCNDFKDEVDDIILRHRHEKNSKILFFIDPCGYKDTLPEILLDLKKNPNTEIILFLPVSFIYRFIDSPQSNPTLDKWKTFMSIKGRPTDLSIIVGLITSRFSQAGFYSGSFILNNQQSSNKYAIFFVSSNVYGLEKFNETKWKIDPIEGSQMGRDFSGEVIQSIAEDWKQESLDRLSQSIMDHISAKPNRMIDNIELYDTVIRLGYLPRHFNEIWKQNPFLVREFLTSQTRSNYISYDRTKTGPLVRFRLKDYNDE